MEANKKIRLGIIGMGRMGITHFSIINAHPEVEVLAIAEPSTFILSMIGKYLPSVKKFRNYNDMIEEVKPDALLVCTPPSLNYGILRKAALTGIHAFVEKPFTLKSSEAIELAEMFRNNHLVNQVGYVNRFNDMFIRMKELVLNRVIGKVIRFKSEMFSCTIISTDDGSGWRASRESGGGALYEMATHAIDLVVFLFGKPDKVIGSSLNQVYSKNVEDAISSTLLYKNGICGTIYINWSDTSYRKPTNKIEILGDGGKLLVDQHSLKVFLNRSNTKYNLREGWNTIYITDLFKPVDFYVRGNEFTRQLSHFIDCIRGKQLNNQCSFIEAASTLETVDKILTDYEINSKINS